MSSYRRYLFLTGLAVGELLVCTPSFSQTAPATAGAPSGGAAFGTVVVTARRRAENVQNIPVSVTAIGANTMRVARISTGEDIQFITPGLTVQGGSFNRESSSYTIRGEAPQGVPVYLDEVPVAGIGQDGGAAVTLPYWDLDSIQVLKARKAPCSAARPPGAPCW